MTLRLRLVCFGKPEPQTLRPLLNEYVGRLDRFCRLDVTELPEAAGPQALFREADAAARKLEGCAVRLALDSCGEPWSSEMWANRLEDWRRESPDVGLVVGSADGLHPNFRSACRTVSLGPVTLPHGLARLVLLEQLYRAHTIVLGLPYHLKHR